MKVIIDSNVLIAAFATHGLCASIFELCVDRYDIVLSSFILSEVREVLTNKFRVPEQTVDAIYEYLERASKIEYDYKPIIEQICLDKDDDEILALAHHSDADYIITGDKDLLILEKHKHTMIITPREFWVMAKQDNPGQQRKT